MATATQLAVAIFGVAPGGYANILNNYFNTHGEAGYSDWLVGMLHNVYGSQVSTNSGMANFITNNLVGNAVSTSNQQFLTGYITTELNNGVSAGALVDNLVNIIDSISTSDTNWGNAASQFTNRVGVADYYDQNGGAATNLASLSELISNVTSNANSLTTMENYVNTLTHGTPLNGSAINIAPTSSGAPTTSESNFIIGLINSTMYSQNITTGYVFSQTTSDGFIVNTQIFSQRGNSIQLHNISNLDYSNLSQAAQTDVHNYISAQGLNSGNLTNLYQAVESHYSSLVVGTYNTLAAGNSTTDWHLV